ncbi:hypothetical protein [Deinococcus sp.]|uniref:hypothetical protein n=1 Tax=Deinococcus sp. TaxID=47478 RepID=UPI0025C5C946|nr:hypothetical protein [Deinococcus sp.]
MTDAAARHHAAPETAGHVLGLIFVQAKFVGDLAVIWVQAQQLLLACSFRLMPR